MYKTVYRLGEYQIIESESGMLWWEAHFPLAMQRRGKCFILGDILILGQPRHEENGYLILEFYEQLEKLPVWDKTSYYCYASNLMDIATGENLSEAILQQKLFLPEINKEGQKSIIGLKTGKFRLGRYQIIVTDNCEVEWQTHEGINNIIGGRCIIESDVLFIGSEEYDKGEQNKEKFISELNRLPQWDNTFAWCKSMVLQACQPRQQTERPPAAIWNRNKWNSSLFKSKAPFPAPLSSEQAGSPPKGEGCNISPLLRGGDEGEGGEGGFTNDRLSNKQPSVTLRNIYTGTVKRLSQSGFKYLKTSWLRIQPGKFCLKYLIPLVVAGFLLGLVILLHSEEKKLHWCHLAKEHHHKHDDEKD